MKLHVLPNLAETRSGTACFESLRWNQLAEPRQDLYDSLAVLALVGNDTTPGRPCRYTRATPLGTLLTGPVFAQAELPWDDVHSYRDADGDHPSINRALEVLEAWPSGLNQVCLLIERLHPTIDRTLPPVTDRHFISSCSHSTEGRFGALWATVNSPIGLAQSLVHEMAHHKLCAYGVSFDSAIRIVANDPSLLCRSPLVPWKRPLMAVLHAHYALLHISALECAILQRERSSKIRASVSASLARHTQLMAQSASVIRENIVVDAVGVPFMQGMWAWMNRVQKDARQRGR
jgi:HEXXH motif-containing protein